MTRLLPPKTSYRFLKEQAKDLLKAHKNGSAEACKSLRLLHRFAGASDRDILSADVALNEIQFALAMDYGFKSWTDLAAHAQSVESELDGEASLVHPDSLAMTLDAINESLFFERPISQARRNEAAAWIAERQGVWGGYMGMPAPTSEDIKNGVRLFTGELVHSRASLCHILGEESCRALWQIGLGNSRAEEAYERAVKGVAYRLSELDGTPPGLIGTDLGKDPCIRAGVYCCGSCSVSLWRHLAAHRASVAERSGNGKDNSMARGFSAGISHPEDRLLDGMKALRHQRDKEGKWKPFPFWYTLLVLTELVFPEALDEMRYAAPTIERSLKRLKQDDKYGSRRKKLAEKALAIA